MTRLYFVDATDGTEQGFVAEFDGPDAPVLGIGARHGHPDGMRVTAIDHANGTYRFENDAGTVGGARPFPPRWFEFGHGNGHPHRLVIHEPGAAQPVTHVDFVPMRLA